MKKEKSKTNIVKGNLHPRNLHKDGYDFDFLIAKYDDLKSFVTINKFGTSTIDFGEPSAVKALNKALLIAYYGVEFWDVPQHYLCPPIPGRADYIHYLSDLISEGKKDNNIVGLDIGVGANCIYPILGNSLYDWKFVATDIDSGALENCLAIVDKNKFLKDQVTLRIQPNVKYIFENVILPEDKFSFSMCNPPFHNSLEEANKSSLRKVKNLHSKKIKTPILNFGGRNKELWSEGGEIGFVTQMIVESVPYAKQVNWFTTLVSKQDNLPLIYNELEKAKAVDLKTIDMSQGQKISRIVAWKF
jgi:23S rRNA (adenine1618-N6)-methyltransferase